MTKENTEFYMKRKHNPPSFRKDERVLETQLKDMMPMLVRLWYDRLPNGVSCRIPFRDFQVASSMELASLIVLSHTLMIDEVSKWIPNSEKAPCTHALLRFRRNNGFPTMGTLIRWLARDSIREDLINLGIQQAYHRGEQVNEQ